ncbi:hypothetical protein [Chitinophaga nivalis]|uniref:CCDC81-like prokaryotic HU domain-containing protein n=1 Tax=Chitinophaga nivalis TaxID=2991709 RepID=A0ABT3IR59_9BACT|nr:hypothetical protein [Chitinophaga nivalis]MCW3463856.1 hypothetical protein [Chitinophaga nivalis]MCW3486454.1 hypothetical protein [Chitinophaga nivalis]
MILQQYIQEVLFQQRVCVVPQLGTFLIQHFPAQYNPTTQTLTAPRDHIIFSHTWKDDGSCLEWIALKENLVPAVAQLKLEKYLEEFRDFLKTGKPLFLPGIGQLQGDFTGRNINFFEEELPVAPPSLPITPVRSAPQKTAAAPVPEPLPATLSATALEPVMTEEVEETLEAVTEESRFKWWWIAIPAAAVITAAGIWWYITTQPRPVAQPAATPAVATTPQEEATTVTSIAATDSTATAVVPVTTATDTLNYFAVIETYTDSTRAARQATRRQSWNQQVILYKRDHTYYVGSPVRSAAKDTTEQLELKKKEFQNNKVYLDFAPVPSGI